MNNESQAAAFAGLTGDKPAHWSERVEIDPFGKYSAAVAKLLSDHAQARWRDIDLGPDYTAGKMPERVAARLNTFYDPRSLFRSEHDLATSGFLFRIQDTADSYDRIAVVFCDGDELLCSPHSACGWNQRAPLERMQENAESGAVDLAWGDLDPELRRQILDSVNHGWRDFMESLVSREAHACAPTREKAEQNEGLSDSAGVGIYSAGAGYCVRVDSDNAADDRGPYITARDALAATLPTDYSLSGPEYHSPLDVGRLEPTPGVEEAVAALEVRVRESGE